MNEPVPGPHPVTWPPTDWQALPDDARKVGAIAGALGMLPVGLGLGGGALFGPDLPWPMRIGLALAVLVLAVLAGVMLGRARWRRTRWRLDQRGLQVKRGLLWRTEVMVPRSRVQHLDLERGPIERRFGLATLVVHTAGTRMHALRQSGFIDADAVALRDALLPEKSRHDDAL